MDFIFKVPEFRGKYKYRIGSRALLGHNIGTSIPGERQVLNVFGINHHCLLLDNDIFEYGDGGYARHRDIGKDPNYTWERVPIRYMQGRIHICIDQTDVSPDELDDIIYNSGEWTADEYDFMNHNCQNFVRWCIDQIKTFPDSEYALDFD